MGNLVEEGLDPTSLKRVELPEEEVAKLRLEKGDILVNRTNSKELVGKSAVFELDGTWVFASYLIRLRTDPTRASPLYVSRFLMSAAGRAQIDQLSRQAIGMANLNLQELKGLLIPLPPLDKQRQLSSAIEDAWTVRRSHLAKAAGLDESRAQVVSSALDLELKSKQPEGSFAITLGQLRGRRLDVGANRPSPTLRSAPSHPLVALRDGAVIDGKTVRSLGLAASQQVPYVGLPDCSLTSIEGIDMRQVGDLGSASVARTGDMLFARIEPSVFNQKYVFIDQLPDGVDTVATSGEFYVIEANPPVFVNTYLYAVLFTEFVATQVRGFTTGSSGRRRLPRELLEEVVIPRPDLDTQRQIGSRFLASLNEARLTRTEALTDWEEARCEFESGFRG
jgi:hypothetical protein